MATTNTSLRPLGGTGLSVFPLCLGGNVFGWTADEEQSFAVLDAYADGGGNFIDTANGYSRWVPGHDGGESERLIGAWLKRRGRREDVVVATKLGGVGGLAPDNIRARTEESLGRLRSDYVDIMYAHFDDADVPQEDALAAFDALVREGKVRHVAASNFTPERLASALEISEREGLARFEVLQPEYNLVEREYEGALRDVVQAGGLVITPYYGLAKGFLTGKYRPGTTVDSPRAAGVEEYLDERGVAVLDAVEDVARARDTTPAAVALAWLAAQPTVVAPIASARNVEQLEALMPVAGLDLTDAELDRLTGAGGR
jgi:aryl-alcohol dehydrogenase-like predicted oxidoreductase